jgi:hypothetical protein
MKRHRKFCRYGHSCARKDSCEFLHIKPIKSRESDHIKEQSDSIAELIKIKDAQIADLIEKIKTIEMSVEALTEKSKQAEETTKCEQCNILQDKVATLEKRIENVANNLRHHATSQQFSFVMDMSQDAHKDANNASLDVRQLKRHLKIFPCYHCPFISKSEKGLETHRSKCEA